MSGFVLLMFLLMLMFMIMSRLFSLMLMLVFNMLKGKPAIGEFKKTTTATETSLNKKICMSSAMAFHIRYRFFVRFYAVLSKPTTWNDQIQRCMENMKDNGYFFSNLSLGFRCSFVPVLTARNKTND